MNTTAIDRAMWRSIVLKVREVYPLADGLVCIRAVRNLGPQEFELNEQQLEWLAARGITKGKLK